MDKQNKKQLYIGPSLQHIQNSELLFSRRKEVLLWSKKSVGLLKQNQQVMSHCKIGDNKILHTAYHPILEAYFVHTDKGVLIVNRDCHLLQEEKVPELMEAKFLFILQLENSQMMPNTRTDRILFITTQRMYTIDISIKYEKGIVKNKSLHEISWSTIGKPNMIIDAPDWVGNAKMLEDLNLLICWNPHETYIFKLPQKLKDVVITHLVYEKISKRDNKINDIAISSKYGLLTAAYMMGTVKMYRYDESKKYVFQIKAHQRECISLYIPNPESDFLYSAGLDNTIKIWQLQNFHSVYQIRIDLIAESIQIISDHAAFIRFFQGRRSCMCELNLNLLQPLFSDGEGDSLVEMKADGHWGFVLYSNNYVECFFIEPNTENHTEKIQLPLKYGQLQTVRKIQNYYALCVQKGFSRINLSKSLEESISFELRRLVYNHSLKESDDPKDKKLNQIMYEKLLDTFLFSSLQDWKGIPFSINVTCVSICQGKKLPMWDLDLEGRTVLKERDFAVLGSEKGYVYFIDMNDRDKLYTRLHIHSEKILSIEEFSLISERSEEVNFFSITETHEIAIWSLPLESNPKIKLRLTHDDHISVIRTFSSYLVVGDKKGNFTIMQVFQVADQLQFNYNPINKQEGHLQPINSCDFISLQNQDFFLTTSDDLTLKIWKGLKKNLILEIKMFNQITNAVFLHQDFDLMISHGKNNQISILRNPFLKRLQKQHNQDDEKNSMIQMNIKEFLGIKQKPKSLEKRSHDSKSSKHQMKKSMSPTNSKEIDSPKVEKKDLNWIHEKIFHIDQSLISSRVKRTQSPHLTRRNKRYSQEKQSQFPQSQSVTLPRISNRQHYKKSLLSGQISDRNQRGAKIIQRIEVLREKQYSRIHRKHF